MALDGVGIYGPQLRWGDPGEVPEAAAELEDLGFSALWFGDISPSPIFADVERLLAATRNITVGTSVLNLWMHEVADVVAGQRDLSTRFPGRFLLGVGVSHGPLVDMTKPGMYGKPLATMRAFLDALDEGGVPAGERALAALGPKMLELARDRAAGVLPYLVTPEHTSRAREAIGPDALLAVEQGVVLEADPGAARARARENLAMYLPLPNYRNNLLRIGFTENDLDGAGSDRLVDGLIAWGDEDAIARRVAEHRAAGADHVCVQVITGDFQSVPRESWRRIAPALKGV